MSQLIEKIKGNRIDKIVAICVIIFCAYYIVNNFIIGWQNYEH